MKALSKISIKDLLPSDYVVMSCGMGTNTAAMVVECVKRGIHINEFLFADTGGEKPHTYDYIPYLTSYLDANGYPQIRIVKNGVTTLEQDCFDRKAVPSIAYGPFKSCSDRFKIQPQDKHINSQIFVAGRIVKLIGFDADEPHRSSKSYEDKFTRIYPLIEWGMGRDECIQSIKDAGLVLPGKSACYFCPNSSPSEIKWLEKNHPDLLAKALKMEEQANLTDIAGLGRKFSWKSVVQQQDAFMDHFMPDMPCGCYDGGAA